MEAAYNFGVQQLDDIRTRLDFLRLTDSGIETLEMMIIDTIRVAEKHHMNSFADQVKQTRDKQLAELLELRNKPKKRSYAWDDTISNLKADFNSLL